jgi:hypothetical protein
MATKKAAGKSNSTAMVPWEEKFAQLATEGVAQVANVGANIHQIKFGRGTITVDDDIIKSGQLECVVLGFVALNRWNKDAYDANNPKAPDCYAFSTIIDDKKMVPHPAAPLKQNEDCVSCEKNAYGSAERGDGKACANTARLGILVDNDLKNAESVKSAEMYTGSVSPTNLKYLAAYLKQLEKTHKRPIWGVVTQINTFDDPKTQIRVEFKMVTLINDPKIIEALHERVTPLQETLQQPFAASVDKKPAARNSKNQKFAPKKGASKR